MLGGLKGGKRRWAPADEGRQWWVVVVVVHWKIPYGNAAEATRKDFEGNTHKQRPISYTCQLVVILSKVTDVL
jgi:hypothetical protein